jgi:hypothetical protein
MKKVVLAFAMIMGLSACDPQLNPTLVGAGLAAGVCALGVC